MYWLEEAQPDLSVFWIHASTAERFRESFASIAQECRIPGYDDPKTDVLALVRRWLERKECGRWLMVIDNADDTQLFSGPKGLGQHIPGCAHGSILVTTRNKEAGLRLTRGERPIEVTKMSEDESKQLLLGRLHVEETQLDAHDLSTLSSRLEYLPLALVQAAAFMQEKSVSIRTYLDLLDKSDQNLVNLLSEEFETTGQHEGSETSPTVTETWILSFNQIQQQDAFAGELLSLMSLFDRQAIPQCFLSYYSEHREDLEPGGLRLAKALGALKAFSFISEDRSQKFDMHRLVQLVTRRWLAREGKARYFESQALLAVSGSYPHGSYENQETCVAYLPHVDAVQGLEGVGSSDEELARASLFHNVAGLLDCQGQWHESERLFLRSKDLREALLGSLHPDTLASMANLAATYYNQGRWTEAESLGARVLEMRSRPEILGPEHPDTLTSMVNLALVYSYLGRWAESEELGARAIELRTQKLGGDHPDTLTSISNLALTFWEQGRFEEGMKLEARVTETRKTKLGADHPDTLTSMAGLASAYRRLGRLEDAVSLEEEVMETRKKKLGSDHPHTIYSMANLASTYRHQGRLEQAESLAIQAVELSKAKLGDDHLYTLCSMNVLASTYQKQGRWSEAEDLQTKELEICTRVQGPRYFYTLTSMSNLACIFKGRGRHEDALRLMQTCFDLRRQELGEGHPSTMATLSTLKAWRKENG